MVSKRIVIELYLILSSKWYTIDVNICVSFRGPMSWQVKLVTPEQVIKQEIVQPT